MRVKHEKKINSIGCSCAYCSHTNCWGSKNISKLGPKLKEGVVATVNGMEISEDEYNKLLNYYLSELRARHNLADDELNKDIGTGMTLLDSLKSEVLNTIILSKIIAQKAEANNIKVDEAELQELYEENHLKLLEEDEDYKKIIEENKIDEDFVKNQMRKIYGLSI